MGQFVDVTKGDTRLGIFGNLHLERMQALCLWPVVRANHTAGLVVDAEHQPAAVSATQVGFIRQCREVLANVVGAVVVAGLLELHHFVFPGGDQAVQQLG